MSLFRKLTEMDAEVSKLLSVTTCTSPAEGFQTRSTPQIQRSGDIGVVGPTPKRIEHFIPSSSEIAGKGYSESHL
jgi:hypothetical protein